MTACIARYNFSPGSWSRSSEPDAYEATALPTELHRENDFLTRTKSKSAIARSN